MILIQEIFVSDDIALRNFACDLQACKGACCVEGDFGAPLTEEETGILAGIYEEVRPYLPEEGRLAIESKGCHEVFRDEDPFVGTTLRRDGACAFVVFSGDGIAFCGIEKAWEAQKIDFRKPISCQLYPIRVTELPQQSFTALNYDDWEICQPACVQGEEMGIPMYRFLESSITRKWGADFYAELAAAADHLRDHPEKTFPGNPD